MLKTKLYMIVIAVLSVVFILSDGRTASAQSTQVASVSPANVNVDKPGATVTNPDKPATTVTESEVIELRRTDKRASRASGKTGGEAAAKWWRRYALQSKSYEP